MTNQQQAQLTCVSLTGADDKTNIDTLELLGHQFPFVEWALLYVPGDTGSPRNPTRVWRDRFFERQVKGSSAVHLCFKAPFEQILAGTLPSDLLRADRLQLNINARNLDFSDAEVYEVYQRALDLGPELILQYQSVTAPVVERFLQNLDAANRARVHVLLDESRGTGQTPSHWSVPSTVEAAYCGFAGGLGPDNISVVLQTLQTLGRRYWVDMESRIRTNNEFDFSKVLKVLQAAAWYFDN